MTDTSIKRLDSNGRLSRVVVANGTVYLSGITAKVKAPDVAAQTTDVLAQIDAHLAQVGIDKTRLLRVNIWLHDMGHFDAMNQVWDAWVDKDNAPARATVESRLAGHGTNLVEMMATAVL
ncbi:RidA family protein [Ancylobacter sonchi]|uniref:RidA family protein n=1 Tax=Ancylobacter sonchi TaxID=1937790 RepID=UPI001BD657CB|nr:RidA family protein [Ancylobacter sonchi]MBS7534723.1 RidA family protein [Ancylobacter sonchi]